MFGQVPARGQVAATLKNIAAFRGSNGTLPSGALTLGSDGDLYGTTSNGGAFGYGTVFKATPAGVVTTLYSFGTGNDGSEPVAGVIQGSDGNLYGSTSGVVGLTTQRNNGTIFQLTPAGVLTTLHRFSNTAAGALIQGRDGNFYGTASADGTISFVSIFRITPDGNFTALYTSASTDGQFPDGKLLQGSDGNFYGVTHSNSYPYRGTVFRITPDGRLTTLYTFSGGSDGDFSNGGLVQTADGNFYGTTVNDGTFHHGTVFRLTPTGVLTTLHQFTGGDGESLQAGLTLAADGNFYGTTNSGGVNSNDSTYFGFGTLFQITPTGALTTLYNFGGDEGTSPSGALVQGANGHFYGTTPITSTDNDRYGHLFELAVSTQPGFFTGQVALTEGVYYLEFSGGRPFGYYAFLDNAQYLYHFDLGYEYVLDAQDGQSGVYLYDFASSTFFYTSPTFPFPYLYDFSLNAFLYYYPDPNHPGRYNTDGVRYFYNFSTNRIISK